MYRPRRRDDRPAGTTVVVDGRFATDVAGMYLAIGEAVNGPGGYFGASPDALADCLCGGFGATVPFTMKWTSVDVVSEMGALSDASHWDEMRDVLAQRRVTLEGLP